MGCQAAVLNPFAIYAALSLLHLGTGSLEGVLPCPTIYLVELFIFATPIGTRCDLQLKIVPIGTNWDSMRLTIKGCSNWDQLGLDVNIQLKGFLSTSVSSVHPTPIHLTNGITALKGLGQQACELICSGLRSATCLTHVEAQQAITPS